MAGTAITTTGQDITGDFDIIVRGTPVSNAQVSLLKSMGSGTTDWALVDVLPVSFCGFVKNSGTNSYKLGAAVSGITVEFDQ